jgi:hypothetical protein
MSDPKPDSNALSATSDKTQVLPVNGSYDETPLETGWAKLSLKWKSIFVGLLGATLTIVGLVAPNYPGQASDEDSSATVQKPKTPKTSGSPQPNATTTRMKPAPPGPEGETAKKSHP